VPSSDTVLKYLSRYTHRVAISNAPPLKLRSAGGRRILSVGDDGVRFQYRDYADHNRSREMTLPATAFLRRFLLHVVPRGFMRILHYGITANHRREQKLARAREVLGQCTSSRSELVAEEKSSLESLETNTTDSALDPSTCPACGGRMRVVEILAPARRFLFVPPRTTRHEAAATRLPRPRSSFTVPLDRRAPVHPPSGHGIEPLGEALPRRRRCSPLRAFRRLPTQRGPDPDRLSPLPTGTAAE
jgi:hypothetical protein